MRCGHRPSGSKEVDLDKAVGQLQDMFQVITLSASHGTYATIRPSIRMRASNLTRSRCWVELRVYWLI